MPVSDTLPICTASSCVSRCVMLIMSMRLAAAEVAAGCRLGESLPRASSSFALHCLACCSSSELLSV
jgi:hypothetical protein